MAQHDYVIDNSTGATVRADINNVLQAIASNNSGSSAPSTTYAFQLFADTTNNVLKIRNAANNGFINLFTLSGGVDVDAASNFNEDVTFTGASANIVFDKSDNALEFADNAKAKFGTGGDLEIYHDSSTNNSIIRETGSGNLVLHGDMINLGNAAQNKSYIRCTPDAQVELYHNNSKKAETVSGGFTVTGTCTATAFSGDGSALTGVGGTTINNNADNRVITGSGTANTLEGESELTYDSPQLKLISTSAAPQIRINSAADDAAATRFTIGRATGNNQFVNGSSSGDSAITVGGNLLFGVGTSEKLRLQSGGGISFNGDTSTDNALDDYEEGTFTPQFAGVGGGPSSITFGTNNGGNYVKIGHLVFVSGRSEITASSGGSQHWLITNMPFVSKSGGKQFESIGHIALENFAIPDDVIDLVAVKEQGNNNMLFSGTRKNNTLTVGISHGNDQVYNVSFAVCYRTA